MKTMSNDPCTIIATLKFNFDQKQLKLSTQHKYMHMYQKKL